MSYIRKAAAGRLSCIFCAALLRRDGPTNLVVVRADSCFAILNRYPYNTGHAMVAPIRHVARLDRLTHAEQTGMWETTARIQRALDATLRPHGYNLGINMGRVAGAGVPGHLHLHIVPRWRGDVNFMPALGGAKVMPLTLAQLYRRLRRALDHRPAR